MHSYYTYVAQECMLLFFECFSNYAHGARYLQFLGTCGCMVGIRAYGAQFAIVFIIQTCPGRGRGLGRQVVERCVRELLEVVCGFLEIKSTSES